MRLVLYHDFHDPHIVLNVIKVSVDYHRTLTVKIKERRLVENKSFRFEQDYQRLIIEVD